MSEYSQYTLDKVSAIMEQTKKDLGCTRVRYYSGSYNGMTLYIPHQKTLEQLNELKNKVINYFALNNEEIITQVKRETLIIQAPSRNLEIEIEND